MDSNLKNLPFVKIQRDYYWEIIYSFLSEKTKEQYVSFEDWYDSHNSCKFSYLVDFKMGLRMCDYEDSDELQEKLGDNSCKFFYFRVIESSKCLHARLKYDF